MAPYFDKKIVMGLKKINTYLTLITCMFIVRILDYITKQNKTVEKYIYITTLFYLLFVCIYVAYLIIAIRNKLWMDVFFILVYLSLAAIVPGLIENNNIITIVIDGGVLCFLIVLKLFNAKINK